MNQESENTFRDHVATMDKEGSRKWAFPKKPKGNYTTKRNWVAYILLLFLFVAPFLHLIIPGMRNQFLLFNIVERKFSIFGFVFFPQDFYLFAISAVTTLVFIILFTVVYGRLFCGWICPQTIFMEMVFRKIEYWIEGDRNKQMKLAKQAWDAEKIQKRVLKWFIFAVISFVISNLFLMYILGTEVVLQYITDGPFNHIELFIGLLIFTGLFYFIFTWFREQVCTIVCPYGRLQGVLVDKDTIMVAYDYKRGEGEKGRKPFRKGVDRKAEGYGDCIDCDQCVVVCPTGIDIRNGTQLECINCTVCMDACDEVMTKMDLPKGLIRYASEYSIANGTKPRFTLRSKAYTVVLVLLVGVLFTLLSLRSDYEVKIFHERSNGETFEIQDDFISNTYVFEVVNKTANNAKLEFKLVEPRGVITVLNDKDNIIDLKTEGTVKGKFKASVRRSLILGEDNFKIEVYNTVDGKLIDTKIVKFNR